jgi:hypothetical protein
VPWGAVELHAVQSLDFSTVSAASTSNAGAAAGPGLDGMPGLSLARSSPRYRMVDETWNLASEADLSSRAWMDRCLVKFIRPGADLTIGRQPITFGKAYFWNPLDVFLAFDPRSFDREYKTGVDAVRLDIPLGSFIGVNVVGAGGRAGTYGGGGGDEQLGTGVAWRASALLARWYATLRGWDLALQGGKVYGGWHAGAGFSGEAGPLELRGEVVQFKATAGGVRAPLPPPDDVKLLDDHVEAVAGLGRRLSGKLSIQAEYLYNGAGLPGRLDAALWRVASGNAIHLGRHLLGATASWELHPLLVVRVSWLAGLSDGSGMAQPGLTYSVSDESDFIAGAQFPYGLGERRRPGGETELRAEFGSTPDLFYCEYKFYF